MKKYIISLIVFNLWFGAMMIGFNPFYSEVELESYVGVCNEIEPGSHRGPKAATLVMQGGKEFDIRHKVRDYVLTDSFREAVKNNEKLCIKYAHAWFTGRAIAVSIESDGEVYLTLDEWNSSSKTGLIGVGIALFVIDGLYILVLIPPKYKRIENRNRRAKLKAKKARMKAKAEKNKRAKTDNKQA